MIQRNQRLRVHGIEDVDVTIYVFSVIIYVPISVTSKYIGCGVVV